ncbi:MAG: SurA N-terminal domain-containing protein [Pseudomonadota bacterium]
MLQAIRDRVTGLVAFVILGLLAIPFVFVGLDSYIQSVPEDAVATIGDDKITTAEFQTSFAQYRAGLRQQQGEAYDEIATNQPIVRREHLEGMIDQLLLRQYAQNLGLTISDNTLAEIIREIPAFQIEGEFDVEQYRVVLRSAGQSPQSFDAQLREDLLVNTLPGALSTSLTPTETEVDQIIRLRQQTRDLALITVSPADFEESVEVSEEDIQAFYEENEDQFRTLEQVRVSWMELSGADLGANLILSEEELQQRYESSAQRYLTPEARQASHILIATGPDRSNDEALAVAVELLDRLNSGEDFAELAQENSDDPGSASLGGDLGFVEPEQMVDTFEAALFELTDIGQLSAPVQTRFGWHIIRLDAIREPQGMSFEQASPEILQEYIQNESTRLYIEQSDRLIDLIFADDSSLANLAEELGLTVQVSEAFSRIGGIGVLSEPQVIEAAFSDAVLLDGAVSDLVDLGDDRAVVVQLEEYLPSVVRPLEEVSDNIRQQLILERAADQARERAELLLAEVTSGAVESLDALAEREGVEVETIEGMARFDFQHGADFIQQAYRLPVPVDGPGYYVLDKGRDFAITRLDAVVDGDPAAASGAERDGARQQLRFVSSDYEIAGLLEYLRDTTEINVIDDRL